MRAMIFREQSLDAAALGNSVAIRSLPQVVHQQRRVAEQYLVPVLLALTLVAARPAVVVAHSGDLDPSFGTDGNVTTAFGAIGEARTVTPQEDQKIIAAGFTLTNDGKAIFALTPYLGDASPVCGDGIIDGNETCDDDNTTSGDGCSATCQVEPGALAYIANFGSNTVSMLHTRTNRVIGTIPVGAGPMGVVVSPDGTYVYVVNQGSAGSFGTVSVIATATERVVQPIPVQAAPSAIAIRPDGQRVYVVNQSGTDLSWGTSVATLSVIDTSTNTVVTTVPLNTTCTGLAVSPDGTLYVGRYSGPAGLISVSTATNSVSGTMMLPGNPAIGVGVGVDPTDSTGARVYVSMACSDLNCDPPGQLDVIDVATQAEPTTVPLGVMAWDLAIDPGGTRVYVANRNGNSLSVVDAAALTATTVPVGTEPRGVGVHPNGSRVYVENWADDTVTVLDAATLLPVPGSPVAVGHHPDGFGQFVGPECTTAAQCNDGNPCTTDTCNGSGGCVHTPIPQCGTTTTTSPTTSATTTTIRTPPGSLCGTPQQECDGGDCCDPSTCRFVGAGQQCGHETRDCHEQHECLGTSPDCPTDERLSPEGSTCSDHNPCTDVDTCHGGVCQPGEKICDAAVSVRGEQPTVAAKNVRVVVKCLSNVAGTCTTDAIVQPGVAGIAMARRTQPGAASCDHTPLPSSPEQITVSGSPKRLRPKRTGLRFQTVLKLKLNKLGQSLLECSDLTVQTEVTIDRHDNRQLQPLTALITLLQHRR
jgi:cysteine-rich repeat protein/YVTN family beta-propeller protein